MTGKYTRSYFDQSKKTNTQNESHIPTESQVPKTANPTKDEKYSRNGREIKYYHQVSQY